MWADKLGEGEQDLDMDKFGEGKGLIRFEAKKLFKILTFVIV